MLLEISVGIIAFSFLCLTVFLICYLVKIGKTIKKVNKLISNMHRLTINVQDKMDALDALFKPLKTMQRRFFESGNTDSTSEKIAEIMEAVAKGVLLFGKVKEELKEYVKSK